MDFLGELSPTSGIFLVLALALALGFEFVNGFHDTANAVATVIYTKSLEPNYAVVWSGCWNLLGVIASTGTVAFSIVALLPVELVLNAGSGAGFAMVFALLISAIIWNGGTWYLGLPISSSHTLIGAILGVGFANALMGGRALGEGVNGHKVQEVFISLLVSPGIGFICAGGLLLLLKLWLKSPELFQSPTEDPPPGWIRGLLILTCTGVSFAHGSNDGQKGMGLVMLILIGLLPGIYALDLSTSLETYSQLSATGKSTIALLDKYETKKKVLLDPEVNRQLTSFVQTGSLDDSLKGDDRQRILSALAVKNRTFFDKLASKKNFQDFTIADRRSLRTDIYLLSQTIAKLDTLEEFLDPQDSINPIEQQALIAYKKQLDRVTEFIPLWVKIAVALSLGLGTTIGWKRIVVTVGERIGKDPLTYAQGAAAELVAMTTIVAADRFGLPVSTTHVLSSGIAGTMAANRSPLQRDTLRNLLLAWVLTLPACMFLGGLNFALGQFIVFNILGLK